MKHFTKRNIIGATIVVLLILVVLYRPLPKQLHTPNTLVFGALIPLSGGAGHIGKAQEAGLAIAEETIRQQNDTTLTLDRITRDSELDPSKAQANGQALLDAGADIIYSSFTDVTREVSPLTRQTKTPLFYDSCNCGFAEENPYAFQLYIDPRKECRTIAERYATGSVAYIGPNTLQSSFCYNTLRNMLGDDRVQTMLDQEGLRKNNTALLEQLAQEEVQALVMIPLSENAVGVIRANAERDNPIPLFCFRSQCATEAVLSQVGEDTPRGLMPFDFSIDPLFVEKLKARIPTIEETDIVPAAVAHDALLYAWSAVRMCGNLDVSCMQKASRNVSGTAIEGNGFRDDRILEYASVYQ